MKTEMYIIQLSYVPVRIYTATNGDIQEGMFLTRDAIDSLLKGEMFSGLDCRWVHATLLTKEDAEKVQRQLSLLSMVGALIEVC